MPCEFGYRILLLFAGPKGLSHFHGILQHLGPETLKDLLGGTDQQVDLAAGEGPGTGFHDRRLQGRIEDLARIEIDDLGPSAFFGCRENHPDVRLPS